MKAPRVRPPSGTRGRAIQRPQKLRLGAGIAVAAALVGAFAASFAACGGDPIYVYQGQRFDPARGCLERPTSLDVVEGPTAPKECPAVCLVQRERSGARTTYVAFTCAPYPPDFDSSGLDPSCVPALAAASRRDGCLPEAGVPETGVPEAGVPETGVPETGVPEAGADANAPSEAGPVEAGVDASADAASVDASAE